MHLSYSTVLTLATLIFATVVRAVGYELAYDENGYTVIESTECSPDPITAFGTLKVICATRAEFTAASMSSHAMKIVTAATSEDHVRRLMAYIYGLDNAKDITDMTQVSKQRLESFKPFLMAKDVLSTLVSKSGAERKLMGPLLLALPGSAFNELGVEDVGEITTGAITMISNPGFLTLSHFMNKLDAAFIKKNNAELVQKFALSAVSFDKNRLRELVGNGGACEHFTKVEGLATLNDLSESITPECFEKITEKNAKKVGATVAHFGDNIVSKIVKATDLHETYYKYLRPEQLAKLGEGKEDRCEELALHKLSVEALAKLPEQCVRNALHNVALAEHWHWIPASVITAICSKPEQAAEWAKSVDAGDWVHWTVEKKQPFLVKGICSELPVEFFRSNASDLNISEACFNELSAAAQANAFLYVGTIAPEALQGLRAEAIKSWPAVETLQHDSQEGAGLLKVAAAIRDNWTLVLEQLGSSLKPNMISDHPCSLIDTLDKLLAMPGIQETAPELCVKAIAGAITLSTGDMNNITPRMRNMIDPAKLAELLGPDYWKQQTAESLAKEITSEGFCKQLSLETFRVLPKESLSAMTPSCVAAFAHWKELSEAELKTSFAPMPENAFRSLKVESMGKSSTIMMASMTDAQFVQLGAEIATAADHPYSLITVEQLNQMKAERLNVIPADSLAKIPAPSFAGLTKARFDAIPEASRAKLSDAQKNAVRKA